MNAYLFYDPRARPLSLSGVILPNMTLSFFLTGTTTPTPVYSNSTLVTSLGTVVTADANGQFPPIYLSPLITYRVQMKDSAGVLLPNGDVDPLCPKPDFPTGTVQWFHGTAAARDIAFPPAQWQWFNGTNGAPDGRDRVPIMAGGALNSGDLGGGAGASVTGLAGAVAAGVTGNTALTAGMVPAPTLELYVWETGGQGNAESFTTSGAHGIAGDNDHAYPASYGYRTNSADGTPLIRATGGGSTPHNHTVPAIADHTHTIAASLPPYVALWALYRR